MSAPKERYGRDVAGMPCFAADVPIGLYISAENMRDAVPKDDENCAIALGCRQQLNVPYVSVGRSRIDIATLHPEGVPKPDHGGLWAVVRYAITKEARDIVIAADLKQLDTTQGAFVKLNPPRASVRPAEKRERNKRWRHTPRKAVDGRGRGVRTQAEDRLTLMGVRNLAGQRVRT